MKKKEVEDIKKVLEKYINICKFKGFLKNEYCSISEDTVMQLIEALNKEVEIKRSTKIKKEFPIRDKDEIKRIYNEELKGKEKISMTIDELLSMYVVLYGEGKKPARVKRKIVEAIGAYFSSIERASLLNK